MVPWLSHERFLPNLFQFIYHPPTERYIQTTESVIIYPLPRNNLRALRTEQIVVTKWSGVFAETGEWYCTSGVVNLRALVKCLMWLVKVL